MGLENKLSASNLKSTTAIGEIFAMHLRSGQDVRMNTRGECMRPLMKKGDVVIVKPVRFEETRRGDIVVYSRDPRQGFTMHRLIKKVCNRDGKRYLVTRGDANIHGDAMPVYPEHLYGRVVAIERSDGRKINLDTGWRHVQAYLIARRSRCQSVLMAIRDAPHLVPVKIIDKIKMLFSR